MENPNHYLKIAIEHVGSIPKLGKRSGIPHQTLYWKDKHIYNVGEDMFDKYYQALAIENACDGLVKATELCQKTAKYHNKNNN
jgi:hypothetical protein